MDYSLGGYIESVGEALLLGGRDNISSNDFIPSGLGHEMLAIPFDLLISLAQRYQWISEPSMVYSHISS
jgi:hypothetical protein